MLCWQFIPIFISGGTNMEKRRDTKPGKEAAPDPDPREGEDLMACEKASSPEIARSQDMDDPCKDGVG
jgi:hypothetical protein